MSYTRRQCRLPNDGRTNKTYSLSLLPFDNKLVLQHNKVTFSHLVFHQTFQASAQRVKKVPSPRLYLLRREEPDPSESGDDSTGFQFIGELGRFLDARDEVTRSFKFQIDEYRTLLRTFQKQKKRQWPSG